jgi:hypothetical protein
MDKIKNAAKATTTHIARFRGRYGIAATLLVCASINSVRVKQTNEFLEAHGLLDEFYTPEGE